MAIAVKALVVWIPVHVRKFLFAVVVVDDALCFCYCFFFLFLLNILNIPASFLYNIITILNIDR